MSDNRVTGYEISVHVLGAEWFTNFRLLHILDEQIARPAHSTVIMSNEEASRCDYSGCLFSAGVCTVFGKLPEPQWTSRIRRKSQTVT